MPTGFAINNVDLESSCEITREAGTDSLVNFNTSIFKQKEGSTTLNSLVRANRVYQESLDVSDIFVQPTIESTEYINGYYQTITVQEPIYPICKKGYRPRIVRGNLLTEVDGEGTRYYYVIKRRDTSVEIYRSIYISHNYSHFRTIPASMFPNSYTPHILFFRMCGGGGGGGGGGVMEGDGGNTGATGGGGGGIAYGWIEIFNSQGSNPSSEDYVLEIFRGGSGGSWGTWKSSGGTGQPSRLIRNGSTLITAEGGRYVSGSGVTNNSDCPNLLASQSGGNARTGVNFSKSIEGETISWSSAGGSSGSSGGWSADGGGSSIGNGGRGYAKSHSGGSGYRGGGGGGGTGFVTFLVYTSTCESGGSGGNGYFALYY